MRERIPEDLLREIKDRISIRDLVADYVTLTRDGANYKGLCPFHREKTPSFKVHEGKGIYKCFGCGESGNVFTFLQKLEGLSFSEAAEKLASRANLTIPKVELTPQEKETHLAQSRLFRVNELARQFFQARLLGAADAEIARSYLRDRGLDQEQWGRFGLGYSPDDWSALLDELTLRNVPAEEIHKAGLIIPKSSGGYYDRFRARVMFPIIDVSGRVRGFGGRIIAPAENQPKYINSPETAIYKKGEGFYGLEQAKETMRKRDRAILVEGYFDRISLALSGFEEAVATLGTALTESHAALLRRYTRNIYCVFDADEAGLKASLRALEILLSAGVSPRIIVVPEGKDPDDFVRARGSAAFDMLLKDAPPLLEFFVQRQLRQAGKTPSDLSAAVKRSAGMIGLVSDPVERDLYTRRLAQQAGVTESEVRRYLRQPGRRAEEAGAPEYDGEKEFPPAEELILTILIHHPDLVEEIEDSGVLEDFTDPGLMKLAGDLIEQIYKTKGHSDAAALLHNYDDKIQRRIGEWLINGERYSEVSQKALEDGIRRIKIDRIRREMNEVQRQIAANQDDGLDSLMQRKQSLLQAERQMFTWTLGTR